MHSFMLTETFSKNIGNTYPYPCMRDPTEYIHALCERPLTFSQVICSILFLVISSNLRAKVFKNNENATTASRNAVNCIIGELGKLGGKISIWQTRSWFHCVNGVYWYASKFSTLRSNDLFESLRKAHCVQQVYPSVSPEEDNVKVSVITHYLIKMLCGRQSWLESQIHCHSITLALWLTPWIDIAQCAISKILGFSQNWAELSLNSVNLENLRNH